SGAALEAVFRKRLSALAFGASVAAAGADVLVGAPYGASGAGAVSRFDGASGATLATLESPAPGDPGFGFSVAALGSDVVVGAPSLGPAEGPDVGAVYHSEGTALPRVLANPRPVAARTHLREPGARARRALRRRGGARGFQSRRRCAFGRRGDIGSRGGPCLRPREREPARHDPEPDARARRPVRQRGCRRGCERACGRAQSPHGGARDRGGLPVRRRDGNAAADLPEPRAGGLRPLRV